MKASVVTYLFATGLLVLLAAGFFLMLLWSADPFTGRVAGVVVAEALFGLLVVNLLFFTDADVRRELALHRELVRIRNQQRADMLSALDAARARVIFEATVTHAEQAAARLLEARFEATAAAQTALLSTFAHGMAELRRLPNLTDARRLEQTNRLDSVLQMMVQRLSHSTTLGDSKNGQRTRIRIPQRGGGSPLRNKET